MCTHSTGWNDATPPEYMYFLKGILLCKARYHTVTPGTVKSNSTKTIETTGKIRYCNEMRLAFCNATRSWGGVKTWTLDVARALTNMGHEVYIYGRAGDFIDRAKALGLPAEAVNFGCDFSPVSIRYFRHSFQQKGIEAVLVNVGRDLRTAGIAAHSLGLPLVQRIGLPEDMRNCLKVRFLHWYLAPHYLCPCQFICTGMRQALPFISADSCTVILTGKQARSTAPAISPTAVHPNSPSPLRLVSTSQLNADKGHKALLHALRIMLDEGFSFQWDVAGTGKENNQLQALCTKLGLDAYVQWHGFTHKVHELLENADVFVLPSYSEGLPNSLLEALAQGLVPISRNVGGIAEAWPLGLPEALLIPNTTTCFMKKNTQPQAAQLDQAADIRALATALRTVLAASAEQRLQWQIRVWQHAQENISLYKQTAKIADFFEKIITVA